MSNESNSVLNDTLGQLEDELRAIKSAREQADGVVSSNSELSAKLERVVVETKGLIQKSNEQTRTAAESLTGEIDRMTKQADAIKKAVDEGTEVIEKYASEAQVTLEEMTSSAVESLAAESERQNEEFQALLGDARHILADLDASIATLKTVELESLAKEVRELKAIEASDAASLRSKLMVITVMLAASIVLCIAVLAKLSIG